ncbi:MAG: hypothetical protein M0Z49_10420 [Chloroflexi bacterium]|nr:hypothetical protein [Chloroflexota bacterium]
MEEDAERGRDGAAVTAAVAIQLGMAALLLVGLSRAAGQPGTPVEPTVVPRALLLPAALALPALVAIAARFGRPALFVAAALAALAVVARPVSIAVLVLLFPAAVFLRAGALRAGSSDGSRRLANAVLAAVAIGIAGVAIALAAGAFLAFWALLIGCVLLATVIALVVLVRLAQREPTRARAVRTGLGALLVAVLAVVAFLLPFIDTATVCWTVANGSAQRISEARADELGRPAGATTWSETYGSVGSAVIGGAGCDGNVPTARSEWLSAAALGCALLVAFAVVPRRSVAAPERPD